MVGYAPVVWSTNDVAINLAGYVIEDFEDATLVPNLLVGCESPAGNLAPTNTLPSLFNPTNDAYGTAFQSGVWDGSHGLVNTRDNQTHSYSDSQQWGRLVLQFPTPMKSVGFSVQQMDFEVRLDVNGVELGGLAALSGLGVDGGRQGYVRIDATGDTTISTIRLTSAYSYDGWVIDHLAFQTNPPPFELMGLAPAAWATNDWSLGIAGWFTEDFEDPNLAPHLLVGCETGAGTTAPTNGLPNLFDPTNDAYGTAFQSGVWDGSRVLVNTRDNQSHIYADTTQWGEVVLQFTVPMRSVAFSVQQMESPARLVINGDDFGQLSALSGLSDSGGRNGFVRIDAAGTNAITSIKLDNASGDGLVLDHLAYVPVTPMPEIQWPVAQGGNDHWYAAVLVGPNGITFNQASNAAVSLSGHLVSISSVAENTFVLGLITNPAFWFIDGANNGEGPWIGGWQPTGSSEPGGGWQWVTGEPWSYTRWAGGEPNNSGGAEDRACFFAPGTLMGTVWNDVGHDGRLRGYVAEFETFPAAPAFTGATNFATTVGQAFVAQVMASGQPILFMASGLPAGVSLDPASGLISGTATNAATFAVQVAAANPFGVTTQAVTLVVLPQQLPTPPGLFAWWTGDDTAEDCVGFFHGQLRNGATFAPGKVGSAFRLDGVNDFVEMPNVIRSNAAFSFAFWMKADAFTHPRYMGAFCQENGSTGSDYEGFFYYTSIDPGWHSLGMQGSWIGDTGALDCRVVQSLQTGVWYHVTATYDGAKLRQYLNGALRNEVRYAGKVLGNPWPLLLGKLTAFPTSGHVTTYFNGLLDEVMFFDRALPPGEVAQIFAADSVGVERPGILPPASMAAWWPGDGNAADVVGWNDGWLVGGTWFTNGLVDQAFVFDSDDDRVMIPHSETLNVSSNGFTCEFWMKADKNQPQAEAALIDKSHGFTDYTGWTFHAWRADGRLSFGVGDGVDFPPLYSISDVLDNEWHHVAGTWDRTNWLIYVDGALENSLARSSVSNNTRPLLFGYAWGGGTARRFYRGMLDEVALYPRALTAAEINTILTAGSVGRQKPACVAPLGDLVAWWPGEGDANDLASGLHGTAAAGVSFTEGRVGRAFRFVDSPNSYVTLPNSPVWLPANNQLTIAAWIKPDFTITGDKADTILSKRDGCGTFSYHFGLLKGHRGRVGPLYYGMSGSALEGSPATSAAVPNDGQFHHVAVTFDGNATSNNVRFYIDGQSAGSANGQQTIPVTTAPPVMGKHAECGYYSSADMDETAFFQRALSAQEIAVLYTAGSEGICKANAPLPPPAGQVAWWRGEGDGRDTLGNHHGALQNGIAFTNGVAGSAFLLDGVNDGVIVPHAEALNVSSGGFTVECWMRGEPNQPQPLFCVIEKSHGWVDSTGWVIGGDSTSGRMSFAVGAGGGNIHNFVGAVTDVSVLDGRFHHLAGTWDGSNIALYVDGQLQGIAPVAAPFNNTRPLNIGFTWGNGTPQRFFHGTVDEVGIYQRALSVGEIRAIVSAGTLGKQPPAQLPLLGDLAAWWPAEDNANDLVGTLHGSLTGNVTFAEGLVGRAFAFDGSGGQVLLPESTLWDFGMADFTLGLWVRLNQLKDTMLIYQLGVAPGGFEFDLQLAQSGQPDRLVFARDGVFISIARAWTPQTNRWYHLAVTRTGGSFRLYVDGQQLGAPEADANPINDVSGPVHIGDYYHGQYYLNGKVDEVVVFQRALAASELAALHAAGSAGMAPPACVPPLAATVGWWPGNNHASDLVGGQNGVLLGATTFAPGKVGQAFQFNGGTDSVLVAPPLVRLTNQFTIAAWINPETHANEPGSPPGRGLVSRVGGPGGNNGYQLGLGNGYLWGNFNKAGQDWNNAFSISAPAPLPLNTWSHVAWTYDQSEMRLYIDGVPVAAKVIGLQAMAETTSNLRISRDDNGNVPFNGLIDEVIQCARALTAEEIAALYAAGSLGLCEPQCAPAPLGMTHWFRGEEQTDDAVSGLTGTLEGGATFAAGRVGQAFSFDGANDLVTYTNFPNLGTNSFSVALWYRADASSASAGNMKLVNQGMTLSGTPANAGFQVRLQSGDLNFRLNDGDAVAAETATTEPAIGVWHHVVAVADRSANGLQLFVDGVLAAQTNYTTLGSIDTNIRFAIGALDRRPGSSALVEFFDGLIDEVLFFDRPLTPAEVVALQASGAAGVCPPACTPAPAGLVNAWSGDNTTADPVGGAHGTLRNGATFAPGRVGYAFSFDGVNDWVEVPRNAPSGAFTFETWIKFTGNAWTGRGNGWNTILEFGTDAPTLGVRDDGSLDIWPTLIAGRVPLQRWTHVACTWDLTTTRLFINGVQVGATNVAPATGGQGMGIGLRVGDTPWLGLIDEVGIYSRALTPEEIAGIYAAESAGKCPSYQFSATDAFSNANGNPNGVWSYGWMPNDFSQFTLYANSGVGDGPYWCREAGGNPPIIWKNTGNPQFNVPTGWLSLHPSPSHQPSVLRWTAPASGVAYVAGQFLPGGGGVMQVAVRRDGQPWWNATDAGSFNLTTAVAAGSTIDFAVYGGYSSGNTPLEVNISLTLDNTLVPTITTQPTNQVVTATRDVTLVVRAIGGEPLSYQWYFTNVPLAGATSAVLSLPLVTTNSAGSYFVVVSNFVGSVTSQWAVLTVLPDTVGPAVANFTPTGTMNTNVSRLTLQFDERIDAATFDGWEDVSILAPTGPLNSGTFTLQPIMPFDSMTFELGIPVQSAEGAYQVQIGPDIEDIAGNPMAGAFTAQFTLDKTGLMVTNVTPSGVVSNTITTFDVSFDSAYAAASLSPAEVVVTGTGAPAVQSVSARGANGFRATLASPLPQGDFAITIGPAINDLAGNPMPAPFNANLTVFLPDLVVSGIAAPATALAGQPLNVSWTVTNEGPGNVTAAWKSRVQLATNAAGDGAISLGTFATTNLLGSATALSQTGLVILPATAAGERWLLVTADVDNDIFENTETNNALVSTSPLVLLSPDLAMAGVSAPAAAQFGATLNVSWAVTNVGSAAAPASWSDRLYLSAASNSLSGATLLSAVAANASPLPATSGYTRSTNVSLPFTAQSTPGVFWVVAVADASDAQPEASEANNLRSIPVALTLPPLPDLAVAIVDAPGFAMPGRALELSWIVTNRGPVAAAGTWKETIWFTNASAGLQALSQFTFSDPLAPGQFIARTQSVTLALNGPAGGIWFGVEVDSRNDVREETEADNLAFATNGTGVPLLLTLQLAAAQIAEDAAPPTLNATLTRNGDRNQPLSVMITNRDTTELSAPTNVVIPAGESAAMFNLAARTDGVVDGSQVVRLTASATNFLSAEAQVTVLDADFPRLTLALATNGVLEGLSIAATVSSDIVLSDALVISLESAAPAQLQPPPTLVIPAGSNQVVFTVTAADDSLVEPALSYSFSAQAAGFLPASAAVQVFDDDVPQVTLTVASPTVSETAGAQATLATVTRAPVSARSVTLELTSSDTSEAAVPARVTIPANQASATFVVAAVQDTAVDGTQSSVLGGYVLATETGARVASLTPATLTITDDDGPALQLVIATKLVRESLPIATTATVTRNTAPTGALVVNLLSSDLSEATVSPTVTIPDGQLATTFNLTSLADGTNDGNQTVTITATAPGYGTASDTVTVSDADLPDLFIASLIAPDAVDTETYATVTYRVANQGFVPTATSFLTRVFLSTDAVAGNDTLAGQFRFNGALPPGQYFEQALQVRLPQAVGDYWVIVETDVERQLAENLENNNVAISVAPIRAAAAYRASVATDVTDALTGAAIPLHGRVTNNLGVGVAYKPLTIHIGHNGTTRLISAITDASGDYSVVWNPLPGEAGLYELGADHPGASTTTVQDMFILRGMRASVGSLQHHLSGLGTLTGEFRLENLSSLPLTALSTQVATTPNVSASVLVTNTLPGSGSVLVQYSVASLQDEDAMVTFTFRFTTLEGAHAEVPVVIHIQARRARLLVTPGSLDLGMVRGEQRFVEVEVANVGGLASSPITLSLPAVPWLQLASTNPVPALAPGETNRFTLQLLPPADLPIGEYNGNLGVGGTGLFVSVPFHFKIVSAAFGDVRITTVDENTYYGAGRTNLAGATVVLRDPFNDAEIARGQTAPDGTVAFDNLREGNYNLEVTAPKHDTSRGVVEVRPGQLADRVIFLRTQLVTYRWTVEEIEIEDRTRITLETTFETFVPTPVVTITPNVIDLAEVLGNEAQVDLKIENHGLIAANDLKLFFGTHPDWELTPLVSDLGALPARSAITVPVLIRRVTGEGGRTTAAKGPGSKDCSIPARLEWRLICGPFGVMYPVPIIVAGASGYCGGGGSGTGAYTPPMWGDPTTSGGGLVDGGGSSGPVIVVSKPPTYSPTNQCACDPSNFNEECVSGNAGIEVDVMEAITDAINTALTPYFMSVDGISASLSVGGELCTCCENGVKGFKANVEAGSGIEVVVVVGFSPDFTTSFNDKTLGTVTASASFTAGLVITLSGSAKVTVETECFLRNPKTCFSGSIGLNFAPQITGTVELSAENAAGDKYGGEGEATVKLETGISINIQGCNDGTPTRIFGEVDDLVFIAGIGGQISMGDHFVGIGYEYKVTLAEGGCIPSPCPGDKALGPLFTPTENEHITWDDWLKNPLATPWTAEPGVVASAAVWPDAVAPFVPTKAQSTKTACVTQSRALRTGGSPSGRRVQYVSAPPQPAPAEAAPESPASARPVASRDESGVCAQVRLQIEQEAVFTRKAVGATLEIFNESDTLPLENLNVSISIYDEDGKLANDRFTILPPELTAITPTSGGVIETNGFVLSRPLWHMDAATTGKARWVILPLDTAAPDGPTTYYVGGIMNYTAGEIPSTARLFPSPVQVYPNARLRLHYFHQRDVFSDDPFTDLVEPAIPFSLGVMVHNVGRGLAKDFTITSAEPRIIDNEKGLLIDFDIIATEVAGQTMSPSLTASFGNLGPGDIGIGRWLLTATLQGLFVDYRARFEHEDSLGGRATSLIEEVTIHETLHLVQAPGTFEDGKPDFLVNDTPDPDDLPDALYLSDGTTNTVEVVAQASPDAPPSAGHLAVQLAAPMPAGWVCLRVPEPGDGQFILRRVVRSDNVEVYFNTNVWTTDRTFIGVGRRPIKENILHLLDYNSPGAYTLHYEMPPAPDTNAPNSAVASLPASTPELFQVQWSGDDAGGIGSYDVFFSANGSSFVPWLQKTKLTAAVFQGSLGSQYSFYSVAVDASGNREAAPLTPDASTSVTITNHPPVITAPGDQQFDESTTFSLQPVVTDADLPDDLLTFALLSAPPGLTINPTTGAMSWATGEGHGPGTNVVTWHVVDNGVPQKSATNSFTLVVKEVNTAPVMVQLTNTTVLEGRWLTLTNAATDADLPAQILTWSLLQPPAGATIDPATGLFRWRPNEFHGGATNAVTIVVSDHGPGQLAATQTVFVTVVDALSDFVVNVGTTNLLAGGGSFVPLHIVAGVPLTNVSFTLTIEESVLTNLVLQPRAAGLSSSSLQRVATNLFRATFELAPGSAVQGTQELARLEFNTSSNTTSTVVPLQAGQVAGVGADGTHYDKGAGGFGRVFLIGAQPIVSDLMRSNLTCSLTLYGRPGTMYRIESATNLNLASWRPELKVQLVGTSQRLAPPPTSATTTYYRAVAEASAGTLTIRSAGGQHVIEWVPTRPNCVLEDATALGANSAWHPVSGADVVLTNGVARVILTPSQGTRFYRLRCD